MTTIRQTIRQALALAALCAFADYMVWRVINAIGG